MNKWAVIKIALLVLVAVITIFDKPVHIEDAPPFFIYPIITIMSFLVTLGFFKGVSAHRKLTRGTISSFPKNLFHDPLPFFHIASIVALVAGLFGIIRDLIGGSAMHPIALFSLSIGFGLFPSIMITNNKFIKEPKKIKKV